MSKPATLVSSAALILLLACQAWADRPSGWWGGNQTGYELSKDTDVKHGGTASLLIRSTADAPDKPTNFSQMIRAENYTGHRVRLRVFGKSDGIEGWGALWMRVDGKEQAGLAFDNMSNRVIKGTNDWAQFDIVLNVAADAEVIWAGGILSGKGKLWFDDFSIEVVDDNVASTELNVPSWPIKIPASTTAPKELVNADMES